MSSPADGGWLPDVNVWVALSSDRHEHHALAVRWLERIPGPVFFCRVTQMSLLRLLTNSKVMGEDILTPAAAVATYHQWLSDDRVRFAPEPGGAEDLWLSMMSGRVESGATWTDAWLAAFAIELQLTLVSFDSGMRRWMHPQTEILPPR
jgi:toxin-antitoxin system PIN domain toxin